MRACDSACNVKVFKTNVSRKFFSLVASVPLFDMGAQKASLLNQIISRKCARKHWVLIIAGNFEFSSSSNMLRDSKESQEAGHALKTNSTHQGNQNHYIMVVSGDLLILHSVSETILQFAIHIR